MNKYTKNQITFLKNKQYLKSGESLPERIKSISEHIGEYAHNYSDGLAARMNNYVTEQIHCPSTPEIANLGRETVEGFPCSCNIITVPNSIAGIFNSIAETAMLSKNCAGVGLNFSALPDKDTFLDEGFYSNSKLDWAEMAVDAATKVSQSALRRGYAVPFFSADDVEAEDILKRCHKNNPNKNDPLLDNNIGFILPTGFRKRMKEGDRKAKSVFVKILKERLGSGKVYLLDEENCNKNTSPVYEKLGHVVQSTNICTEVLTPHYDDKTFACIIYSLNLNNWDEMKANPQIIKDAFYIADIIVQIYIDQTEGVPFMEKARRSAIEKRDIGIGTLGFHDYLQSKGVVWGSLESRRINKEIYSTIRKYGEEATREMAERLGSPKMCQEAGLIRRNVSLMMVAPNKSTSFIFGGKSGRSLGIEPQLSNYFIKDLAGIQVVNKNLFLEKTLQDLDKDTNEVWDDIAANLGSVQHLDFLDEHTKKVFKTASEISPKDIIDLAADRQVYIDMSQSLNLFNRPNYSLQDVINIHLYAFENGIKTLYYYYPQIHAALEQDGGNWDTCESCAD